MSDPRRIAAATLAALFLVLPSVSRAMTDDPTGVQPGATIAPAGAAPQVSRLQGRTYLGRRDEVVGATVLVRPEHDASRLFLTSSDSRGNFRMDDLPDGSYSVEVRREGLLPVAKSGVGLRFPFRAVVELPMQVGAPPADPGAGAPAASAGDGFDLRGQIAELDGAPLPDMNVRLVRQDGGADPRVLRSNDRGRFAVEQLAGGRWMLEVQGVGFLPIRTPFDLSRDSDARVSMVRQPADYVPSPLELMPPERAIPPAPGGQGG